MKDLWSLWRRGTRLPRNVRRGGLLLVFLLLLVGGGMGFWLGRQGVPRTVAADPEQRRRCEQFLAALHTDSARPARRERMSYAVPEQRPETFFFDPNTADSTELLRLGLAPWQVRNIYKYRARGGRYHTPDDFARLYGMTGELFARLRPYIRIDERFRYLHEEAPDSLPADSIRSQRPEKFAVGTRLDLNGADTADLQRVPGIGSVLARRVVRYRERLGGFVTVSQLAEVEGLPADVERWFFVLSKPRPGLNLNKASLEQLMRHPYLNFYQSRAVVEHRRKFGPLRALDDLALYEVFSSADLERLRPYVCF